MISGWGWTMYGVRLYQKVTDDTNTTTRAFDRNWIFTAIMYYQELFLSMIRIDGVQGFYFLDVIYLIKIPSCLYYEHDYKPWHLLEILLAIILNIS